VDLPELPVPGAVLRAGHRLQLVVGNGVANTVTDARAA
jgi:hypothetical protein